MSVLLVDDHALLGRVLAESLAHELGVAVHPCVPSELGDVRVAAARHDVDTVLLDLDLAELGSSLPLIAPLTAEGRRVLVVTGVTDELRHAECLEHGAIDVFAKSRPFEELADAVRRVRDGLALRAKTDRDALLDRLRRSRRDAATRQARFAELTPSEAEVLRALVAGRTVPRIAEERVVEVSTVRSQIRAILHKLGVHSQVAAIALAVRAGWGEEP